MKFTADSEFAGIINNNRTLTAQVKAALSVRPQTSFELEDGLNRLHQSVSSTLHRLVRSGQAEVKSFRTNQYGNKVGVYSLKSR